MSVGNSDREAWTDVTYQRALARAEAAERKANIAEDFMWQAAGLGAGAVMEEAPDVEMPTAKISDGMGKLLAEYRRAILNEEDE